jgi:plasmid stability protein
MSKMIQIRNVPDDVHRCLKTRAAARGMSLSDYLKVELVHLSETLTLDELHERIRKRPRVELRTPIENIIREDRESH